MSILKDLKVPVFKAGGMPTTDLRSCSLLVGGLVERVRQFSWHEILAMPRSRVNCRLTSVSGWSVRADWEGIRWEDFLREIVVLSKADHVRLSPSEGATRPRWPMTDLRHPRVLLAYNVNGEPIEPEYGGPLRMVIPNLWDTRVASGLEESSLSIEWKGILGR